jgi:hypothetical protein
MPSWRPSPRMRGSRILAFKSVDSADAEASQLGGLDDAGAFRQLQAGTLDLVGFGTRAPQLAAHLARLAGELAVAGELVLDDAQPCPDPLVDHRALELGKGPCDLEQQLARRLKKA